MVLVRCSVSVNKIKLSQLKSVSLFSDWSVSSSVFLARYESEQMIGYFCQRDETIDYIQQIWSDELCYTNDGVRCDEIKHYVEGSVCDLGHLYLQSMVWSSSRAASG